MLRFLKNLTRRTPLGFLQLSHDKTRLLIAISGIAFADLLIFMQLGFQGALYSSNTRLHNILNADIVLISPQARNLVHLSTITRRRLYQAMDVPGVADGQPLYVNIADWKIPGIGRETNILVLGFNPDRPPFDVASLDKYSSLMKLPDTVVFDQAARGDYGYAIERVLAGERAVTEVENRQIEIAGLYEIGASFAADGTIMTSDRNFLRLFSRRRDAGGISAGLLYLESGADPQAVANLLKTRLPADVQVLTREEFIAFEREYWSENTAIGFVFRLGAVMGFLVGLIIVYQVLSTDVADRLGEYATFKAMGYQQTYLLGIVFEEAMILVIAGFFPGLAVSMGLYRLTRQATNLPMYMTLSRAVFVLILTILMCCFSGAIATRKLQAADPADLF
ncbi:MAG: FtsX-like permease family protein [Roseofilum sp. SBFL]|uniref:ABC transporter permease DevC n=1 Tax=unclassified Roseofilum TaxID=2620099 RepID=UPI001B286E83|nr:MULTISPECIES: ABC transporter permease DevC [unclassified Roseofilum]MBP0014719.1 FtsX-like permease family protein [Roseofilum sp. SID3]MBP0025247.1 FtsX-like permease family protein [Roseofilum sp. SID2]MBP0037871.1 FtsX-like permease family protein [Roseofilum sp. SID1]MBP0042751.1 FtsX-like permease family protein [Roseofilum sp. SBFL]